jgi:hypothetical protein
MNGGVSFVPIPDSCTATKQSTTLVENFMLASRRSAVLYVPVGQPPLPWDLPQSSANGLCLGCAPYQGSQELVRARALTLQQYKLKLQIVGMLSWYAVARQEEQEMAIGFLGSIKHKVVEYPSTGQRKF